MTSAIDTSETVVGDISNETLLQTRENGGLPHIEEQPPQPPIDVKQRSAFQEAVNKYWYFVGRHPLIICLVIIGVSSFLTILGFSLHPPTLTANPEEAFKAWKTDISGRLNTWNLIGQKLTNKLPGELNRRRKRFVLPVENDNKTNGDALQKQHANKIDAEIDEDYGFSDDFGEVESENDDLPMFSNRPICLLTKLADVFGFALDSNKQFPMSTELPLSIAVYELDESTDISSTMRIPKFCNSTTVGPNLPLFQSISMCDLLECEIAPSLKEKPELLLPQILQKDICSGNHSIDVLLALLKTRGRGIKNFTRFENLVLCTVQKIFLSKSVWGDAAGAQYTAVYYSMARNNTTEVIVHNALLEHNIPGMKLVGVFAGEEGTMNIFSQWMWQDMRTLIPVTLVVVFTLMLAYTGSIFYSFTVLLTAGFSFTVSYFMYFLIFETFWFTNYLGTVILLGIGADDCFVLVHNLQSKRALANGNALLEKTQNGTINNRATEKCCMNQEPLSPRILRALKHASITMFITSATTAAAFLCNFITPVMGIKAFGIFAGLLVVTNYILVVSLVPASLILKERYLDKCGGDYSTWSKLLQEFISISEKIETWIFQKILPKLIDKLKHVLTFVFLATIVVSCIFIFGKPGLQKAQDSTQLFPLDNPIQWFQNNFLEHFNLKSPSSSQTLHVVWGLYPKDTTGPLGHETGKILLWPHFEITSSFMKNQNGLCQHMEQRGYFSAKEGCFASFCQIGGSNRSAQDQLKECVKKANENPAIAGTVGNGPWFDKDNHRVKAYIQSFHKQFPGSAHTCDAVTGIKEEVKRVFQEALYRLDNASGFSDGWVVPSSNLAFRRLLDCDLQDTLQKSTVVSVSIPVALALAVVLVTTAVSQLCISRRVKSGAVHYVRTLITGFLASVTCVAIIASTIAMMALMRWKLNTVESVIIALCIGLSFDFTMHYAYAYVKTELTPKTQECLASVFKTAGVPVLLSFISTFFAGFIFLFSHAYPFYQVGLFMIIVTAESWVGSTFLFTAAMATLDVVLCKMLGDQLKPPATDNSSELELKPINNEKKNFSAAENV